MKASNATPTNAELLARISARVAEFVENERLARARGTYQVARARGLGPAQQRALTALKERPRTPLQLAHVLGVFDYAALVVSLAGLVTRELVEVADGGLLQLKQQQAVA